MERALIFFDVDGTILDSSNQVPESAINAICTARANGHICIINTGRPYSHLDPVVKSIGFDGYICSCGQHIIMEDQRILYKRPSTALCQQILQLVRQCGLDVVFEGEDGVWFDHTRPMRTEVQDSIDYFSRRGFDTNQPVDCPDFHFDKFCVWVNPDSNSAQFLKDAAQFATVIDRGDDLLECVLPDCSKETGMRRVMAITGIPAEACYAIGDSTNDLPMLRAVTHSIAMGGAPPEVQAAAEFVTAPVHLDGLAKALSHYGLI